VTAATSVSKADPVTQQENLIEPDNNQKTEKTGRKTNALVALMEGYCSSKMEVDELENTVLENALNAVAPRDGTQQSLAGDVSGVDRLASTTVEASRTEAEFVVADEYERWCREAQHYRCLKCLRALSNMQEVQAHDAVCPQKNN